MDPLLDNAPCGFATVLDDGHVAAANLTLASMLDVPRQSLLGRHVDTLLDLPGRIFYQTHVFPALKLQTRVHEVYLSLRDARGDAVPVLLNASRRDDGNGLASHWVVVPMRQRNEYENEILKARRAAEEAGRAKDEFLSVVSHELRSPLSAITGWAHLLGSGKLDAATQQRALRAIQDNAAMQVKLVDDLLDFGRIATGKLQLELAPLALEPLVASAAEGIMPTAQVKGLTVDVHLDGADGVVAGDPDRLRQVLWNLLANAVKFTPRGGRITVRVRPDDTMLEVSVTDTGRGISPEFLPHIFDRFRQEGAATRRESGLGLGMAITRQLVELHGGTIAAASDGVGRGATFTLRLPRAKSAGRLASPASEPAEALVAQAPDLAGIQVLILQRDGTTLEAVRAVLESAGAAVETVGSAGDAELAYRRSRPAVLVSDVEMERGEGLELIRRIRELEESSGARTPAIALTGRARQADRLQALAAGFQVQLLKPVEPTELLAAIANLKGFATQRVGSRPPH